MSAERMPTSRGITPLADIPDGKCRDGGPELVIRGEHPGLVSSRQAVPVLPRRRDQIREPGLSVATGLHWIAAGFTGGE